MKSTVFTLAALALLQLGGTAYATDSDGSLDALRESTPRSTQTARQETLELPGLTACHQCEWRPKMNKMAAQEQCGSGVDGSAKYGQFECGFSPDCDRVCNFIQCVE